MPVLHTWRAECHITRIKNLNRLSLDLVIANSVCRDQDLSALMRMPVIDHARIKDNIVKIRCCMIR